MLILYVCSEQRLYLGPHVGWVSSILCGTFKEMLSMYCFKSMGMFCSWNIIMDSLWSKNNIYFTSFSSCKVRRCEYSVLVLSYIFAIVWKGNSSAVEEVLDLSFENQSHSRRGILWCNFSSAINFVLWPCQAFTYLVLLFN